MTWEIVLGIIALFGFVVAVVRPIVALTKVIEKLNGNFDNLQGDLIEAKLKNTKGHERIWDHMDTQDGILLEHEERLSRIDNQPISIYFKPKTNHNRKREEQ